MVFGSELENYSVLGHVLDMILHQHRNCDQIFNNSYSKSIWRQCLGQWLWPGSVESVTGIFMFSEVCGFHSKSQKT